MRQQPIDRQRKAGALKLAEEHGSAEASRRTGVSADTIRYWRHKAAKAPGRSTPTWTTSSASYAWPREARAAAEEALAKVREALADGKRAEAKSRSIAYGICVEKPGLLAQQAQQAREHELRVTEEQANIVVRAIRGSVDGLGARRLFSAGRSCREAGAPPLRAGDGPVPDPGPAEDVAAARAELRTVLRAELLAEGLVVEARAEASFGRGGGVQPARGERDDTRGRNRRRDAPGGRQKA